MSDLFDQSSAGNFYNLMTDYLFFILGYVKWIIIFFLHIIFYVVLVKLGIFIDWML